MPQLFSAIVINTLTCDFKNASPNLHFLILHVPREAKPPRVDWKVAISSGAANSGCSVSGHVAPSLAQVPCQRARHSPLTRWRSCKLWHLRNISSRTFCLDIRGPGKSEVVKRSFGRSSINILLSVRLLRISGCFSIKILKFMCTTILFVNMGINMRLKKHDMRLCLWMYMWITRDKMTNHSSFVKFW